MNFGEFTVEMYRLQLSKQTFHWKNIEMKKRFLIF